MNDFQGGHRMPPRRPPVRSVHSARRRPPPKKRRRKKSPLFSGLEKVILMLCAVLVCCIIYSTVQLVKGIALQFDILSVGGGNHHVIVIDPGHGGIDRGAEYYAVESEETERTASALQALLMADENYDVLLTKQAGEGLSIADRASVANSKKADLFLSIHFNSDETYSATGFECYPQTPGSEYYSDSMRFAKAIAEGMGEQGQNLRGFGGVRFLYYTDDGEGGYQKLLREINDTNVYPEQTFGVLEQAQCPAVLAEQCFLTSDSDVLNWTGDSGAQKAARVYYEAICEYFGTEPIAG